jgi:threonine/homoserine/homoserine lactone efflux protein
MSDVLPSSNVLLAFTGVAFVLAVTPGPGVLYIVTRSVTQGRVAGLASVAGVGIGNAISAVAASFGLGAVIATSVELFNVLKWAGALYLFYLAGRAITGSGSPIAAESVVRVKPWRALTDGALVATLNPKTALFFAALLPQFVDAHAARQQALILSCIFVGMAVISDTTYALVAGASARVLVKRIAGMSMPRYIAAAMYAVLGLIAIFSPNKQHDSAPRP